MSFFGCHSGLFSATHLGATDRPSEKQGANSIDEQQPLVGPGGLARGAADAHVPFCAPATGAPPKEEAPVCVPATAAPPEAGDEWEAASLNADEPEESQAQPVDQATPPAAAPAGPEEPAPAAELQPAAPAHLEGSYLQGAVAGGRCVPRARRRRTKGAQAARHEEQEVTATADAAKVGGDSLGARRGKSRALAGA